MMIFVLALDLAEGERKQHEVHFILWPRQITNDTYCQDLSLKSCGCKRVT